MKFMSKLEHVIRIEEFFNSKAEIAIDDKGTEYYTIIQYLYDLFRYYKIPILKIYKDIYKRDEK